MSSSQNHLEWMGDWFASQCNGDWEHEFGITIDTLDNPGWSFRADLSGTPLADRSFVPEEIEDGERWLRLWKEDRPPVFHAAGSPETLPEIFAKFHQWASAPRG